MNELFTTGRKWRLTARSGLRGKLGGFTRMIACQRIKYTALPGSCRGRVIFKPFRSIWMKTRYAAWGPIGIYVIALMRTGAHLFRVDPSAVKPLSLPQPKPPVAFSGMVLFSGLFPLQPAQPAARMISRNQVLDLAAAYSNKLTIQFA